MYKEDVGHLLRLQYAGFNPKVVFDIGVSNGEFFYACQQIFTSAKYYLFEARKKIDTDIAETVKNSSIKPKLYFDTLLGDEFKAVDFFNINAGSSVFEEQTKLPRTVVKKQMRRLGDFISGQPELVKVFNITVPRFLKIDTQGSELAILSGMAEYLQTFEVVQLEVALLEYNLGAPTVTDVMAYMDSSGFALYDIGPAFRRETDFAMFHVDFVFVAKRSKLRDKKDFWNFESQITDRR